MSQSEGAKLQTKRSSSLQCEMPHAIPNAHIEFWISILLTLPTWLSMQWHLVQFIFATSIWPISLAIVHDSPEIWSPAQMVTIFSSSSPAAGDSSAWTSCNGLGMTVELNPRNHRPFRWTRFPVMKTPRAISFLMNRTAALKRIGCSRRGGGPNLATTNGKGKWLEEGATLIHLHDHGHSILTYYDIYPYYTKHWTTIYDTIYDTICCQTLSKFGLLDSHDHRDIFLSSTQWCLWDRRPWPD